MAGCKGWRVMSSETLQRDKEGAIQHASRRVPQARHADQKKTVDLESLVESDERMLMQCDRGE